VFVEICEENQDVIQVYYEVSFFNLVSEDFVHHLLEGGRQVREPEEHDLQFEQPAIGFERGLLFVTWFDAYIVVAPTDIELCED